MFGSTLLGTVIPAMSQLSMLSNLNLKNIKGVGKWVKSTAIWQGIAARMGWSSAAASVTGAAAESGKSVAKIPVIGPLLAIAAIAAVARMGWKMFNKGKAQGRAKGGPVKSNNPYMVGEKGPELFMPMTSGHIIPHMAEGTVNVSDNSGLESKIDQLISIAAKQPTAEQAASNQRDTNRNLQGAFAQR